MKHAVIFAVVVLTALTLPSYAQQAVMTSPASRTATNASGTIAVTDTFQAVWAAQPARVNCVVQNNGAATMWVFVGSGTPTKGTSALLAPTQSLNCATSGVVASSAVWITGTATQAFYASLDGAPIINAASSVTASFSPSGTQDVNLTQVGGAVISLGQGVMTASVPVVVASNQSALDVGAGVAGAADTSVVTMQGIASMTPVAVSQATAASLNATVVGTGTFAVQATLAAGSAVVGNVRIDQTTPGTTNGVQVNAALPAGTALIGSVGIDQTTPGTTNNVTSVPSSATAIGITPVVSGAAADTLVLKASAGNLYSVYVTTGATGGYLMVFNSASEPGDGAVTPLHCLQAPANSTVGLDYSGTTPAIFSTGITASFSTTGCFTKTTTPTVFFSGAVK